MPRTDASRAVDRGEIVEVRILTPSEVSTLHGVHGELHRELVQAVARVPLAACCVDGRPVSFCYVAAETETLWDVSIDTLAAYRGRGLAAHCVRFLIEMMHARGKVPVWGALVSNLASLRLAATLGFSRVDTMVVFTRP